MAHEKILRLPPRLYSVTALPSKAYTTANVDAHVWLIDVNGPSATTKVTVMRLVNNIQARLQCSMCSCVLRRFIWLQGASLDCISCPESLKHYQLSLETSDGHCLTSVQLTRNCHFFSQTIHTCHRPSLVRKLFLLGVWPPFFTVRRPFIKQRSSFVILPFKPRKMIKTI